MLIFFQYPYMFTVGIKTVVLKNICIVIHFLLEGAADPRGTTVPPSIQRGLSARSQPVKQLLIVSFPVLFFTNLLFSTFNELHPNYFRHLLHALGMNIKVDDMKSNTQPSFVSVIPHLTESFTSVLTVSSALLLRITLHSILCFAGFLQLVFLCSKSIPWQDYKLLYLAT